MKKREINEKARNFLCSICNAFIMAGMILLFIGIYYAMIKAGIPYQDPPPELQIQYAINAGIGSVLIRNGFKTTVFSSLIRFVLHLIFLKIKIIETFLK